MSSGEREAFHFEVNISPNVDPWNDDHDIIIDIHATSTMTLDAVHTIILKSLELKNSSKLYYHSPNGHTLEKEKTLEQLGIGDQSQITLDRMRRYGNFQRNDSLQTSGNSINIFCVTRLGAVEGSVTRTKVTVDIRDDCAEMMEEISRRWGKSLLKFKYGRTILKAGKTFEEIGMDDGCEVVVTGGRG